jgi:hypothetical protein
LYIEHVQKERVLRVLDRDAHVRELDGPWSQEIEKNFCTKSIILTRLGRVRYKDAIFSTTMWMSPILGVLVASTRIACER